MCDRGVSQHYTDGDKSIHFAAAFLDKTTSYFLITRIDGCQNQLSNQVIKLSDGLKASGWIFIDKQSGLTSDSDLLPPSRKRLILILMRRGCIVLWRCLYLLLGALLDCDPVILGGTHVHFVRADKVVLLGLFGDGSLCPDGRDVAEESQIHLELQGTQEMLDCKSRLLQFKRLD